MYVFLSFYKLSAFPFMEFLEYSSINKDFIIIIYLYNSNNRPSSSLNIISFIASFIGSMKYI